jgi:hypothetical protein
MSPLYIFIASIFPIGVTIFILIDTKKRNMSLVWVILLGIIGLIGLVIFESIAISSLIGSIGLIIYLIARKPVSVNNINKPIIQNPQILPNQNIDQEIIIPDTCPHCKSPNTKKIRLCEWCGNQIT